MPIIKSAKKRVKTAAKATARNTKTKRTLRDALREFSTAVKGGKKEDVSKAQSKAFSAIDTAAKKNIIHKNKAARKKAAISKAAKSTGSTPVKAEKKAAKPAAKKAVAKKAPAKKSTAKKAPAKKK